MINNPKVISFFKRKSLKLTEKKLLHVIERFSYYDAYELFDYMHYDSFCELLELYNNHFGVFKTEVKHYKHFYIERTGYNYDNRGPHINHFSLARKYNYTLRDMTDEYVLNNERYWYQDLKKWCKSKIGRKLIRHLKMERIV